MEQLRSRITNVREGPIEGDVGYMLFDLDGKPHKAAMTGRLVDKVIGINEDADKAIASMAVVDELAKPVSPPAVEETAPAKPHIGRKKGEEPPPTAAEEEGPAPRIGTRPAAGRNGRVSRAVVESVFPGATITATDNGWGVEIGDSFLTVEMAPEIALNRAAMEATLGRRLADGEFERLAVLAAFSITLPDGTAHSGLGLIRMVEGMDDVEARASLMHEAIHMAVGANMFTDVEWAALVQEYASGMIGEGATGAQIEERVAEGVASTIGQRKLGKADVWGRIKAWFQRILAKLGVTKQRSQSIHQLLDTGDFWQRAGKDAENALRGYDLRKEIQFGNQNMERRWQKSHGLPIESWWEKFKDAAKTGAAKAWRAHEFLPAIPKWAVANESLRLQKNAQRAARDKTVHAVGTMLAPLDPDTLDLFERYVGMKNMLAAIQSGHGGPRLGAVSEAEIEAEVTRLGEIVANYPNVQEALEIRHEHNRQLVQELVDNDLIPASALDNVENYYHQQIITKQEELRIGSRGSETKPFQRKRSEADLPGEEYDWNTSFIEAEVAWITDANELLIEKGLRSTLERKYGNKANLKADAKRLNYLELVGGEANAARIEELKVLMKSDIEGEYRAAVKEELAALDPTYPHRIAIAIAMDRLGTDYDLPQDEDALWAEVSRLAAEEVGPALGLLKAINEQKAMYKEVLGDKHLTWEKLAERDENLAIHQWAPGRAFYVAYTLPEKLAEQLQLGIIEVAHLTADQLQKVRAVGAPHEQEVFPLPLVKQLEAMKKDPPSTGIQRLARQLMRAWKMRVLIFPDRILPYNARNATGDTDPVVAAAPGVLFEAGKSAKSLWHYYYGKTLKVPPNMQQSRDLAVITSSQVAEEVGDLGELDVFRRFYATKPTASGMPLAAMRGYLKHAQKGTEYRENILRYAAFTYYQKHLKAGTLKHYGTSRKAVVDELHSFMGVDVAAAHLSRNLLGDYGNRTVMGNWLRMHLLPFWSWAEINLQRYPRLLSNAVEVGGVEGGVSGVVLSTALALRIGAMAAAFAAFNYLFFPDEEEELGPYDAENPHIILGRNSDGSINVFRNPGAFGDFLEWFGMNEMPDRLRKYMDGQMTVAEILAETAKAPVNKLVGLVRPDVKAAVEIPLGASTFPDVFNPRTADRGETAAGIPAMQNEYRWVKGMVLEKGDRVRPHYWRRWLVGVTDPRQNALSEMYDLREQFRKQQGKSSGGRYPISKYRNARYAAANEDYEAFREWRTTFLASRQYDGKYADAQEGFVGFLGRLDPIADGLNEEDEKQFETEFLNSGQKKTLLMSRQYARELADRLWHWWAVAAIEDGAPGQASELDARTAKDVYLITSPKHDWSSSRAVARLAALGLSDAKLYALLAAEQRRRHPGTPLLRVSSSGTRTAYGRRRRRLAAWRRRD